MERNVNELESVKNFKVETLEIAGLHSVLEALHLPFGRENASDTSFSYDFDMARSYDETRNTNDSYFGYTSCCYVNEKDTKLLHSLINNGDEHAKAIRGIIVWAKITAPRFWWSEADTYRIGSERLASNSTMHQQGKGLDTYDLVKMKENLPESTMQTRIQYFSYQTLRRIYFQRRNHRLPQWHMFCKWIETLPFAEEWITFEKYGKNVAEKKEEKGVFIVDWDGIQFVAREYTDADKKRLGDRDVMYSLRSEAEKYANERNHKLGIK